MLFGFLFGFLTGALLLYVFGPRRVKEVPVYVPGATELVRVPAADFEMPKTRPHLDMWDPE